MALFTLVYLCDTFALTGEITHDPAILVEKYLSLDKRGVRLEAYSFEVLKPYTTWTEEPAWGRIVVISKYQVIDDVTRWEIINSTETLIPVTFEVVGTMHWETATFWPESRVELEHFHVKAINNRWQIVGPQLPPHVGTRRLIDYVRLAQLQEVSGTRKATLQKLQQDLEKAR